MVVFNRKVRGYCGRFLLESVLLIPQAWHLDRYCCEAEIALFFSG